MLAVKENLKYNVIVLLDFNWEDWHFKLLVIVKCHDILIFVKINQSRLVWIDEHCHFQSFVVNMAKRRDLPQCASTSCADHVSYG